jgi:hypothetical protein
MAAQQCAFDCFAGTFVVAMPREAKNATVTERGLKSGAKLEAGKGCRFALRYRKPTVHITLL